MKYIITLCLLIISVTFAADTSTIDEFMTPESIDAALAKAAEELKTITFDESYLSLLRNHYESISSEIFTANFVKYYLVGTFDLHELLVIAETLQSNTSILISQPDEQNYLEQNRIFCERFLSLFYAFDFNE